MDALAPLYKKARADAFLNGNGPFNLEKPFIPPSLSYQSSISSFAADHSSSSLDAILGRRRLGCSISGCLYGAGCPYGEGCYYAHYLHGDVDPLSQLASSSVTGVGSLATRKEVALATGLSSLIPPTDKGSVPEGYKSRLCKHFETAEGCRFGDKCHFAHGEKELRKFNGSILGGGFDNGLSSLLQPADQEAAPAGYKSRLCKHFETAEGCRFGDKCHFAHGEKELRNFNGSILGGGGFNNGLSSLIPLTDQGSIPEAYKSKLCKNFETAEGCRFGDKCNFAHGEKELRKLSSSILAGGFDKIPALVQENASDGFKTRLCKNFQASEGCRFGEKCYFAHGEKELRPGNGSSLPGERSLAISLGRASVGMFDEKLHMAAHREPTLPGIAAAASFGAISTAKISIDASLAGLVVGKAGVNAKSISRVTGARLYVKEHESDSNLRNIEMEGSFDQIKQASAIIHDLLLHLDANPTKPAASGSHFYKTRLCENFSKGSCAFGDQCRFAHGSNELRTAPSA